MKLNSIIRSRGCFLQTYLVEHKRRSMRGSPVGGLCGPGAGSGPVRLLTGYDAHEGDAGSSAASVWPSLWRPRAPGERSAGVSGAGRSGLTRPHFTPALFSHTDQSSVVRPFHHWGYDMMRIFRIQAHSACGSTVTKQPKIQSDDSSRILLRDSFHSPDWTWVELNTILVLGKPSHRVSNS